jgi:hypothetical protein
MEITHITAAQRQRAWSCQQARTALASRNLVGSTAVEPQQLLLVANYIFEGYGDEVAKAEELEQLAEAEATGAVIGPRLTRLDTRMDGSQIDYGQPLGQVD